MNPKTWRLSRRTMLRGAGVALALPLLEGMAGPRGWAKAAESTGAGKPPVRMGALFFPNGVWQDAWIPKKDGADYELPFSLEPLKEHKSEVLVLSQLDKFHSREGDGHYAKTANFLTGLHVTKTTGKEIHCGGISIDQLAAQKIGNLTPLPSLELGIDPVISGIDSNVGYTRLYGSYISWQSPTQPVAKEINPRIVYERLFGAKGASKKSPSQLKQYEDRRSLLDMALEDANSLRKQLGRDDQFKLDEYLDSVRAVERQIEFFAKPDPRTWKPTTTPELPAATDKPDAFPDHVRVMLDLMVLAFWTDSTRISTFMFANDVSGRNFSFVDGVKGAHHELSHHENNKEKIEQYQRINRWHVEQFAYLLGKLRGIKEGQGTLLDNSMILCGCGMSDGNRHDPNNLPILLGGRGGNTIQSGRHIASKKGTPLCNLYLSMLERVGAPVERFGDSKEPLPLA